MAAATTVPQSAQHGSEPKTLSRNARLASYFWKYKKWFLIGGIFLVVTNLLAMLIPGRIGAAVEILREADSTGAALSSAAISEIALTVILLAVGAAGARIFSRIFVFNAGRHVEYQLRNDLFDHLASMSQRFFQSQSTGDLVSRSINDVNYLRLLYGVGTLNLVNTIVAYVMVLTLMLSVSTELTLYSFAPYPFVLFTISLFTRALYTHTQKVQARLSDVSARAQENLSGAAVVRAFSVQKEEAAAFRVTADDYLRENIRLALVRGSLMPYMGAIAGFGTLIVLWFGGSAVIDGELSLGQFVEFSGYIGLLAFPTIGMGWVLAIWHRGIAAFDRLTEVLNRKPVIADPPEPTPLPETDVRGEIVLDGVSLTYADGTKAIDDISLTIAGGSRVAIVGRTGSGKSSLMDLFCRLRDPSNGTIALDGVPLENVELTELRQQVVSVPQTPFLFSMSIRDNLMLGKSAREARGEPTDHFLPLDDALRASHLEGDLDALTDGLDTVVGERGITLSGGQKQRVTLARALITNPRVLLLDDALASVDTGTERKILDALDEFMVGRTTVLVTHRFNALELMDLVVVMEDGRIVETGTHRELCEAEGVYAEMVARQELERELEEQP